MLTTKVNCLEKYFFLLLVFIHLAPVFLLHYFVTLDGPAHIFHSYLIPRLMSGNTIASDFMQFNTKPVPYWTGQFIVAALSKSFSPNISERILVALYVLALPLAFRKFILTISSNAKWVSYLIFPFIYSFLLYIGFYNFCIALPVLFLSLSIFLSKEFTNSKKTLTLIPALLLLYFSHLFVLFIFFLFAGVFYTIRFFLLKYILPLRIKAILSEIQFLVVACIPVLSLTLYFILTNSSKQFFNSPLEVSELIRWIYIAHPLITFKYDGEGPAAILIALTLAILTIYMIYAITKKKYDTQGNVWLIFSLLLLLLYFILPNNLSTGGFVSMRLLLFFYLFLISSFAFIQIENLLKLIAVTIFISVSIYFLGYHYVEGKKLSASVEDYISLSEHIKENSLVLPLNYSTNWMHSNLAAYIGTHHNILIMEDYDASSPHFPITWKQYFNGSPTRFLGTGYGILPPCADIDHFEKITGHNFDYVMRWEYNSSYTDSCSVALTNKLEKNYNKVYVSPSGNGELFERKR